MEKTEFTPHFTLPSNIDNELLKFIQESVFTPPYNEGIFIIDSFLYHLQTAENASLTYLIPWENGCFFVPPRDCSTSGCVGCLLRRLSSHIYNTTAKIDRIDAVLCKGQIEISSEIWKKIREEATKEPSSTKCYFFDFSDAMLEELHVLPVPGCLCSREKPYPNIPQPLAESWLAKWPNSIFKRNPIDTHIKSFHIRSSSLPNIAFLCIPFPQENLVARGYPTSADFRDSKSLDIRLIGESIERYSFGLFPLTLCDVDIYSRKCVPKNKLFIEIENYGGIVKKIPAEKIYAGLHRFFPSMFNPLSSSGVAAHKSIESARFSAALEIIERDALIIAWRLGDIDHLSTLFPLPIDCLTQIKEFRWANYLSHQQGHELQILGVQNQCGLPIALAMSIPNQESNSTYNIGSGIGLNWHAAVRKALCELLQGLASPDLLFTTEKPTSFVERPRYWKEGQKRTQFLSRLRPRREGISSEEFNNTKYSVGLENSFISDIYFADITPPDILASGWHVVRAINESCEPFSGSAHFENPSLTRVNQYLSSIRMPPVKKINIDPFPFP